MQGTSWGRGGTRILYWKTYSDSAFAKSISKCVISFCFVMMVGVRVPSGVIQHPSPPPFSPRPSPLALEHMLEYKNAYTYLAYVLFAVSHRMQAPRANDRGTSEMSTQLEDHIISAHKTYSTTVLHSYDACQPPKYKPFCYGERHRHVRYTGGPFSFSYWYRLLLYKPVPRTYP